MENELQNHKQLLAEIQRLKTKVADLEKYKAFFEKAPLSYQSLNINGNFIDVNTAWLKTLGYKKEEVVGQNFGNFIHPDWKKHFERNFEEFRKKGFVNDVIFPVKHKNGHFIYISFDGLIGRKPDGSFEQTHCIFHDITRIKAVENDLIQSAEREQILADVIRNSPVAIAFGYPDGSMDQCNRAFEKLTGYSEEELKKIKWDEVLTPPKWKKMEAEKLNELTPEKNYVRYEKEYIHKSGRIVPVELNVTAKYNENGNLIHFIGFATDITERKKNEEELELHRKNLEVLIEERTRELQNKNKELDKALKVFVGREMLIKELQKKIKALGGKL
jgi:PAS domain S-box-containing protein